MANVKLVFYNADEQEKAELVCFKNIYNNIFIQIDTGDCPPSFIVIDKSTAIKFAKTLRTEINKIT